jgi:hypothetical protein
VIIFFSFDSPSSFDHLQLSGSGGVLLVYFMFLGFWFESVIWGDYFIDAGLFA